MSASATEALVPRASATLELTSDAALEEILADIPFFCVGLVAFAFFAFMLVMKRVTLLSIYLYSTALFSFGAAVLDLAQILARGPAEIDLNTGITQGITALINTREVGLSIAVGFRFLFFWAFVAERPRGEPPPTTNLNDPKNYTYYATDSHSARWERWGYLGYVLKWLILTATLSIPILQIIWRIAVRHYGTLYMVESTIEILVSALLILKVFLNIFLSPDSPWWKPFRYYGAPLITLLINLALGIGELVYFRFSEIALGRFLQALEVYTLIIFLLIVSFYKIPVRPSRPRSSIDTPYMGDEKAGDLQLPTVVSPVGMPSENRLSTVSRVSSWIFAPRGQSRAPYQQRSEDVELALGPAEPQTTQLTQTQAIAAEPSRQLTQDLGQQSILVPSSPKPELAVPNLLNSRASPPLLRANTSSLLLPDKMETSPEMTSRPSTGVSLFYYGMDRDSRMSFPNPPFMANDVGSFKSSGTESPVYGLDGIVNQRRLSTGSLLRPPPRGTSVSSFDELIQQQAELDRSIAALRLFSPPTTFEDIQTENKPVDLAPPATTSSSNNRTVSTVTSSSARSEFSLSIFPDPPELEPRTSYRASYATVRGKRQSRWDVPTSFDNGSLDVPSLPGTPTRPVPGRYVGSNATQYDVTSFIGDLTKPSSVSSMRPLEATSPFQSPLRLPSSSGPGLADIESESEVESPKKLDTPAIPTFREDQLAPEDAAPPHDSPSYPQLRPFFLGNVTSPTTSSPLAGGARGSSIAPLGPRKPARGRLALPSNPRLVISEPRRSSLDGIQAPGAFERPRPPPSFTPSDNV